MPILRMVRGADFGSPDQAGQGEPLPIVAATAGEKQDGLDIANLPWDFSRGATADDGRARFPMLWSHDFGGRRPPIGVVDVGVGDDEASLSNSDATFDPDDEFAVGVERKYRSPVGGLTAFSISWEEVDADGMLARKTGKDAVANQLLEVSAVPVPMDPDALAQVERMSLRSLRDDIDAVLGAPDETDPDILEAIEASREYVANGGNGDKRTPEPVELNVNYSVSERTASPDGAMPTGSDYESLVRGGAAGAMLAVFDPATEWTDAVRRERYNWACVLYRWLGLEAPEFVDRAELDALDTEAIRELFLAGEERIGKELSARNIKQLTTIRADVVNAGRGLTDLLARVTGNADEDERGVDYGDVLRGLSEIGESDNG